MQPTEVRGILLDIEGTTSSISFVHDVMFPYVLERLETFVADNQQETEVRTAIEQIAVDAGHDSLAAWTLNSNAATAEELVIQEVRRLMAQDSKATGLKALQGIVWRAGFNSGELRAHVYPDVIPSIQRWKQAGIDIRIYSSGSIAAQKLFFGHLEAFGDCLQLFSGHYDTTFGGKKEISSYQRIAIDWQLCPSEILFVSDIAAELEAAQAAGLQTRASVRPGNSPLPETLHSVRIRSFEEI